MQQDEEETPAQVTFLTDAEKDYVARLRLEFKDDLNKRRAEGRYYECFFGDVALCRVCQCCNGDFDHGKFWFGRWLYMAAQFEVDALMAEVYELWKGHETTSMVSDPSILPFHDEVRQYMRLTYAAPKLSSDGDMVAYMPMSDQDKHGVLAGLEWDHFAKYQRAQILLRALDLDRLSRAQNRMAKVVWICDLNGCTMDSVSLSSFDRMQNRDINGFAEVVVCEVVHKFFIVNAPWAVSALHNLAKAFMPEKFARKTSFVSGDGLRDTELIEKTGGEEQLRELYATRAGLVAKAIHKKKEYNELLDTWADEEEQEIIDMLRTRFKDEFEKRKQEGRDYEPFFGDYALLRVVRGNNGCLGSAVNWFKRFLKRLEEHKLDSLIEELTKKLDESGGQFGSMSMLPYAEEIQDHSRLIFTAPRLSPSGDVVSYLNLGDHNRVSLLANVPWEHWARHVLGNVILRSIECDHLSRTQKRLVRFIQVVDLEGAGIGVSGLPSVPEFDLRQKVELEPLMMEVSVDVMRATYVLNAPWLAVKAYNFFRMLVPERISRKINLVDGDGRSDYEFVKMLGGEAQLQQFLASRVGLVAGVQRQPNSGLQEIAAGGEFQQTKEVRPGQRVEWRFTVDSGSADNWLGASDVAFSVTAFWYPQVPETALRESQQAVEDHAAQQSDPEEVAEVPQEEGSLEFDGAGGYVQITEVPSFKKFTWSVWVKPAHENWWKEHIILRRADQICLNVIDGSLRLWLHDGHWHCVVKVAWDLAFADTWHHLAASYDGEMAKIFVNGTMICSSYTSLTLTRSTSCVLIGAGLDYADCYWFKGQITEVRLHSTALSTEQISKSLRTRIDPRSDRSLAGYAQLCGGVSFVQRQGLLLENNIGKVAARSYYGGATFASSHSPFSVVRQVAAPAANAEEDQRETADDEDKPATRVTTVPQPEASPSPLEVILPVTMLSSGKPAVGRYDCNRTGVISLKWSNAHSKMRSKSLNFSVEVTTPVDVFSECDDGECSHADSLNSETELDQAQPQEDDKPPAPDGPPKLAPDLMGGPPLAAAALAALHERAAQKLSGRQNQALPEVRAALAVAELAKSFKDERGPHAIYMADE